MSKKTQVVIEAVDTGAKIPPPNRVLHPDQFPSEEYIILAAEVEAADPSLWARKFEGAKIQYLYAAEVFRAHCGETTLGDQVLVVGSYEDPMVRFIDKETPAFVQEVDPNVNGLDLHEFLSRYPYVAGTYAAVVSMSVLEHVGDRYQFIDDIVAALRPGGLAILTCDYMAEHGDMHDYFDQGDLDAIKAHIEDRVHFIGTPDWSPVGNYFDYQGVSYAFAGIAFTKKAIE